jgi:polysaccharide pyruvyl transferase CsaB
MGNGGDEALLASLLQMLPDDIQPLVLSANPQATEQLHQVEACDRFSVSAILKAFKQSDIFIWGGGSLMQDSTSARNPIYYGGLMGLAQGMGLKTVAWAQGIGPLHRRLSRWIARRAFSRCQAVSVRDRQAAELLATWNIPCTIAPDPVWALTANHVPSLQSLHAPRIAVVLRSHPLLTPLRINCLIHALEALQKATDTYLLLIPFQPKQDKVIAQAIHAALPQRSKVIVESDPRSLKGIFHGVEMAIVMRLHGLIMAAAEGAHCSAISYDPKMSTLMEELDIPGWELSALPDDAHEIAMTWIDQFANSYALDDVQRHSLSDRALMHKQVLAEL